MVELEDAELTETEPSELVEPAITSVGPLVLADAAVELAATLDAAEAAVGASVIATEAPDAVVYPAVEAPVNVVVVLALEEDSDAHFPEKPFTIAYTFNTKPLVVTVRSQSGGFNPMIDVTNDWQLSDAHMSL
ncbi:hypothetical protein PHYBOEH_011840 [Phytophthora boehmeriae]|uniref:Uncharacterized protein n=1 Tax=Phytophthora boehmeriae TaxID=109152 RepID=A0A8T1X0K2_9STRA|nr:hypothetical protein PHYBOEH_011840 [Phytophthora boehmeriae]